MDREKFIAASRAAFGERWQTDMAHALGVSDRTVRNWVSGKYNLPPTLSADIKLILEKRKAQIKEAIEMSTEKFLMNPFTGSVDTEENWKSDMQEWETMDGKTPQEQFDSLIEVTKNESGDWIEVK